MNLKKLLFSTFILATSFSSISQSTRLYAGYVRWTGSYSDSLAVMDTTGGTFNLIEHRALSSDAGTVNGTYGLSLDPVSGEMYILYQTAELDEESRRLGLLDTLTGAITDIGVSGNLTDIAFSSDGNLYGTTGSIAANYSFMSVDKTDASTTELFVHISDDYGPAIGYDYFNGRFLKVDRGDGVSFIEGDPFEESAVAFTSHPGEAHAITFKNDSTAIVVNYDEFYEFNMNTGVFSASPVYSHIENIHAMAFGDNPFAVLINGPRTFCSNQPSELSLTDDSGTDFQWYLDGEIIAGATASTYTPTESGSYNCEMDGRLTSSINVMVIPAPNASFTATPNPVYLDEDPTGTVVFTNTSDSGSEFHWDFDNGFTSTTENPEFPFTSEGSYDVSFIVKDLETGCSDTAVVTVVVEASVGIAENLTDLFSVYPTPASDVISISYLNAEGNYTAQLLSMSGAIVATETLSASAINTIDISQLENGVYLLKIFNGSQEGHFRIVKQ